MHTIIKLPKNTNIDKLFKRLKDQNILIDDYRDNYLSNFFDDQKFIKINVMNIDINRIDKGISLLNTCIGLSLE